jgi:predicted nucleotidyltransferase
MSGIIKPIMGFQAIKSTIVPVAPSGVADALFSKVQQRVLAVLFGNHSRSFYGNELIALAGSGSGAVQRELARLAAVGLVTVKKIGNQKHYQADSTTPFFDDLRRLVMKTSGLVDVVRSALAPVAGEIIAAFVFGSVAKGKDTVSSDIDLMIISNTLAYGELFAALEPATNRFQRTVKPTLYSRAEIVSRRRAGNPFVKRVLAQPKLWIIGQADELDA